MTETFSLRGSEESSSQPLFRRGWMGSMLRRSDYVDLENVIEIIQGRDSARKQKLSEYYFLNNTTYKRIILYYSSLLKYTGILIPNSPNGTKLSEKYVTKIYDKAIDYWDKVAIEDFFTEITASVLVYGYYCGLVQATEQNFFLVDLPTAYSRAELRDLYGNKIVEFNLSYFDTIRDKERRAAILNSFPRIIREAYYAYTRTSLDPWFKVPTDMGISFSIPSETPPFLNAIEAIIRYDQSTDLEMENLAEEVRKIVVQKIPFYGDGELLFEPTEAAEIHEGTVHMMRGNPNVSVLTTYADVEIENSQTTTDSSRNNNLTAMSQNIYQQAGAPGQAFATTNAQSMKYSLQNDLSFAMILANQYSTLITLVSNKLFSNKNITFKYKFLPVSWYNDTEYISNGLKLAAIGGSYLIPALAMGVSQGDIINLKEIENDVLNLEKVFVPLAQTQAKDEGAPQEDNPDKIERRGRPRKPLEEKSAETIRKENEANEGG